MNFKTAVRTCLHKYIDFSGRAGRREYWFFFLFMFLLEVACGVLAQISSTLGGIAASIVGLGLFLPMLAVGFRRLHDTGRSGLWLILWIIPILWLVLLYFLIKKGDPGPNRYGAPLSRFEL